MTSEQLLVWRKRMRLRKNQAARLLGINPKTYAFWEAGIRVDGSLVELPAFLGHACTALVLCLPPFGVLERLQRNGDLLDEQNQEESIQEADQEGDCP